MAEDRRRTVASATQQRNQRFTMRGRLESHMQPHLKQTFLSAFPRTIMKTKNSFMQLCISEDCNKEKNLSLIKASATFIIKNQSIYNECAFFFGIALQSAIKRDRRHRGEHGKGQKEEERKQRHMVVLFNWKMFTFYCYISKKLYFPTSASKYTRCHHHRHWILLV